MDRRDFMKSVGVAGGLSMMTGGLAEMARADDHGAAEGTAARAAMRALLGKAKKRDREQLTNPVHPWGKVFGAVDRLQSVDPRLKHIVLSRAHLP